jgi:hypothetical protein
MLFAKAPDEISTIFAGISTLPRQSIEPVTALLFTTTLPPPEQAMSAACAGAAAKSPATNAKTKPTENLVFAFKNDTANPLICTWFQG